MKNLNIKKRNIFFVIFIVFFIFLLLAFGGFYLKQNEVKNDLVENENLQQEFKLFQLKEEDLKQVNEINKNENFNNFDSEINLLFVGDIMLDRGVKKKVYKLKDGDYSFVFEKVSDYLKSFDAVFGNLEGPVSDKGFDLGNKYSFRMEPKVLNVLKENNFKGVFLSNNHIGDWGKEALLDTLLRLKEENILAIGIGENENEAYNPKYFEIKNTKIAVLSFADFIWQYEKLNTKENIALTYKDKVEESIKKAKENSDLVIVHFHFGEEYQKEPTKRQKDFSYLAINSGADLVVGTHPHVIGILEEYNKKYIAYSLGNFIFDQNFSKETMTAGLLEVKIKDKKIEKVELKEAEINSNFQVEINF